MQDYRPLKEDSYWPSFVCAIWAKSRLCECCHQVRSEIVTMVRSVRFLTPFKDQKPVPNHYRSYWGNPISSFPSSAEQRRRYQGQRERQKKNTVEGGPGPPSSPSGTCPTHSLSSTLALAISRGPRPNRRVLQKFNHSLRRLLPPHPSHRRTAPWDVPTCNPPQSSSTAPGFAASTLCTL